MSELGIKQDRVFRRQRRHEFLINQCRHHNSFLSNEFLKIAIRRMVLFEYQYARIEILRIRRIVEKQIRRIDSKAPYAVLIRRLDTPYPTGGYAVSVDQSEQNTI
ncbi:hypothetical protein Tco_0532611 [Tanacetum coccineum]